MDTVETTTSSTYPYAGDDPATRAAISAVLEGVTPMLRRLIRQHAPRRLNADDREDLLQGLLLRAWFALRRFDTTRRAKPSTFVYFACRNELFSILRRKPPRKLGRLYGDRLVDADPGDDVEQIASAIIAAPEQFLTERQIELARLIWERPGAKTIELAAELGITASQVGKLRRRMNRRILEQADDLTAA